MYAFDWDGDINGIRLRPEQATNGQEVRPVWAQELEYLGFNSHFSYEKTENRPLLWAIANSYYYRGKLVARVREGSLKKQPRVLPCYFEEDLARVGRLEQGSLFDPQDEVVKPKGKIILDPIDTDKVALRSSELLKSLAAAAQRRIAETYESLKGKLDVFHVAFSGGKDSIVLLDLIQKTLPVGSYVVMFGDTGMEFPDTYEVIDCVETQCKAMGIPFYRAGSHWSPSKSWKIFGPPSTGIRWCCSVHKSAPQTLLLKQILRKPDYIGLDFTGIRANESLARSGYLDFNHSAKQEGQYNLHPILDWSSAEIWLYIFANKLFINGAYKKGNSRAGCLACPMSGNLSNFIRFKSYRKELLPYMKMVKESYKGEEETQENIDTYLYNRGWCSRKTGCHLFTNKPRQIWRHEKDWWVIELIEPMFNWQEWLNTLGTWNRQRDLYMVYFRGYTALFKVKEQDNKLTVTISAHIAKDNPNFFKYFRLVLNKITYCRACRVCESNCSHGALHFEDDKLRIQNCVHCLKCFNITDACLLCESLHLPKGTGELKMSVNSKKLNTFDTHAPKPEWLRSFFALKQDFFTSHSLGPNMYDKFRRFLRDAELIQKNSVTSLVDVVGKLGWNSDLGLGIILTNLVYNNPQIAWYIQFMDLEVRYTSSELERELLSNGLSNKSAYSVIHAFKRLAATPLGTVLNWGRVEKKGKEEYLVRTAPKWGSPLVLLYSLFKFAEAMGGEYRAFNLGQLADPTAERQAVSPLRLWGATPAQLKAPLLGLNARYPEYIQVSFTHDLDSINLGPQSSAQVLELIQEV